MPVLLRSAAYEAFEVLTEKAGIGEVQRVRNLGYLFVAMPQHHLGGGHYGLVYPFFCRNAACLPHHRAEVAFGKAYFIGVERQFPFFFAMSVHQLYEAVEHAVRRRTAVLGRCAVGEEAVIVRSDVGFVGL